MNFYILTLGCKVNQYESEAMLEMMLNSGFEKAESAADADIVIINSCTVTSTSDKKLRQTISKIKRENIDCILILTGCMPQAFPKEAESYDNVDILLGNSNRSELVSCIMKYLSSKQKIVNIKEYTDNSAFERININNFNGRTRAFVKIEDGCNRFCSYCIIPYARGRVRSKPLDEIIEEIENLKNKEYKEIVLVGINLSAYGQDIGLEFFDAVKAACSVDGIDRVRLGSMEPDKLNFDIIKKLSKLDKLCPQFHLSLQSGCDDTLKRMNRHYKSHEYYEIVKNLRENFENASITTDIMVGFPGESEEEFNESLEFVKKVQFAKAHIFSYSRRGGTKAYLYKDQISENIKNIRNKEMAKVTLKSREAFLQSQVGVECYVLFENIQERNCYFGYTKNYTPVVVKSIEDICGKILKVKIEKAYKEVCQGVII